MLEDDDDDELAIRNISAISGGMQPPSYVREAADELRDASRRFVREHRNPADVHVRCLNEVDHAVESLMMSFFIGEKASGDEAYQGIMQGLGAAVAGTLANLTRADNDELCVALFVTQLRDALRAIRAGNGEQVKH